MISNAFSSSSAKGVLLFGVFVLVAAGLFFIPELINLQSSLSGDPAPREPVNEGGGPEVAAAPSAVSTGLDRVLAKIDSGEFDSDLGVKALDASGGPVAEGTPSPRAAERFAMLKTLRSGPLTWDLLKRPEVVNPIIRSYKESETLLKVLDPTKTRARTALLNFRNALYSFLKKDPTQMTPKEMLSYLGGLDVAVTQAFIADRIERTEYSIWKAISLGSILHGAGSDDPSLDGYKAPFEPKFTLTNVWVRERKEREKDLGYRYFFDVKVAAVVTSRDVRKIEVYRAGKLYHTATFDARADRLPRSRFIFPISRIPSGKDGKVTFKLLNEDGVSYEKTYMFGIGARKLGRGEKGEFNIPRLDNVSLKEDPDEKIDKLFRYGGPRRSGSGGDFAAFTGNTFFEKQNLGGSF